ncbi:cation:proton antiporter domain-containing protein [Sphingomonas nostoxanthinifaciens]|uniref:cation:proton antiporter domain-containing protein n=1 Tax=Sphingomonas nostoxanthinifaciens TaxID=2872652 RepID=UPI001CC1FA8E|nr:cation:proton antiporter [Sphingomonas nostoxanthinifaciens]UAK23015.1 cation:proton antiporter [Sphingomonas nostoxanthinifaciens]
MTGTLLSAGVVMLGAALGCVLLFRKFGLGATLGYIVAGALIGPQALGLVDGAESKLGIADLGITLLLFIVGLELNLTRLWRLRRDIFGFGLVQVVICGLALGGVVWLVGFSPAAALALGLPLALSSTAQVLPMLRSAGRLNTPFGERAFSILLFQDLSIVPLITIVAALSRAPADPGAPPGWLLGLYTIGAVVGLVVAGRYLLNPLFRLIGGMGERELFVAAGLFTVVAAAAVMESLHLSTALGAFVAGVMLADSPYRHELEVDVEPFRTVLLGLFFIAIGMKLDLHAIEARPIFVLGLAVAVVAVKAFLIFLIALLFGVERRPALALGLLLSQGGEFGFVLFGQAAAAQLVQPQAASLLGAVVTLSMATTPFLMMVARRFNRAAITPMREDLEGPDHADHAAAIVVGYGRFGQTIVQMLLAADIPVTVIDSDAEMIDTAARFGVKVFYGDGTRLELLQQAGGDEARAIIFAMDKDQLDRDELETALKAFRQAAIFVRAYDRRTLISYRGLDTAMVIRELFESAVVMGRRVLATLGVAEDQVAKIERRYRARDKERLLVQAEKGIFSPEAIAASRAPLALGEPEL